jgi:type IV pilus assembly protein PilC
MPDFVWKARSSAGMVVKGEMTAPNEFAVMARLKRMKYVNIKVKKKPKDLFENVSFLQPKVPTKEIVIFTRQFATMIDAGLPLIQCLEILANQQQNRTFKKVLTEVKQSVEGGNTLADSLKKHPKIFDDLFVNLVRAGETGGVLDTILRRLSTFLEKSEALKRKVKGAMVYPVVMLIVAVAVVAILLVFVIPVFKEMFAGAGQKLPAPTLFVIGLSEFVRDYIIHMIVVIGLVVYGLRRYYNTPSGRLVFDSLALKTPGLGDLLQKVAVARFCSTLGTMLSSGVPIMDALAVTARTAGNQVIEKAVLSARKAVSEGRFMADPLMETGVFPGMVIRMIAVGEATGALDAMLAKISEFYESEVDTAVQSLTQLLEPIMIVFLGGVCGGMVIAMYLPIFSMAGAIAGAK